VSLLQSVVLSSQLKHMLGSLGSSGTMRLVYNNQREPFFVSKTVRRPASCSCACPAAQSKLELTFRQPALLYQCKTDWPIWPYACICIHLVFANNGTYTYHVRPAG
jgi:hypothetical protein